MIDIGGEQFEPEVKVMEQMEQGQGIGAAGDCNQHPLTGGEQLVIANGSGDSGGKVFGL